MCTSGHPGDREGWQGASFGQGHEDPQGLQGEEWPSPVARGTSVNFDVVMSRLRDWCRVIETGYKVK